MSSDEATPSSDLEGGSEDENDPDFVLHPHKQKRLSKAASQKSGSRRNAATIFHCTDVECGKTFKSNSDLQAHVRTHTGEKPLKCKYAGCDAAFAHSSNRRQHERSKHEKVKRYHCRFAGCKKKYAHPTSRNDHEAVKHRGERPYKCGACGADFTSRANRTRHQSGGDCKGVASGASTS